MRYAQHFSILALVFCVAAPAGAQQNAHTTHNAMHRPNTTTDTRELVHYPPAMKAHTLANMRDHLVTLEKIQRFLANQQFDAAAEIAEQRLGMSAMALHGAREASKFMPEGMQSAGASMHHNASRFAQAATDASVTGDLSTALKALAEVTASCTACHQGYRLQ